MSEYVRSIAEYCAAAIEVLGLAVIVLFGIVSLVVGATRLLKNGARDQIFKDVRRMLGQGILLGLEFLVAADIIHTVAVDLTFESVGVLALIVLIRTFLSFTLDLELTGRWPWQKPGDSEEK